MVWNPTVLLCSFELEKMGARRMLAGALQGSGGSFHVLMALQRSVSPRYVLGALE
jgi:hypothetical protein